MPKSSTHSLFKHSHLAHTFTYPPKSAHAGQTIKVALVCNCVISALCFFAPPPNPRVTKPSLRPCCFQAGKTTVHHKSPQGERERTIHNLNQCFYTTGKVYVHTRTRPFWPQKKKIIIIIWHGNKSIYMYKKSLWQVFVFFQICHYRATLCERLDSGPKTKKKERKKTTHTNEQHFRRMYLAQVKLFWHWNKVAYYSSASRQTKLQVQL